MKHFKRNCVVYCCINIVTQEKYVGSTVNFSRRKRQHLSDLKNQHHRSENFQKSYNSFGEISFRFFEIEKFETDNQDYMLEREQFWIDKYKPELNANQVAGSYFNEKSRTPESRKKSIDKRRGRKHSEEERKKRSTSLKAHYSDPANHEKLRKTPEQKEAIRQSVTGERNGNWGKKRTEEFKSMIGDLFSSMQFVFISPDGQEVVFRNLTRFCKDNGLPYHMMRALHQGKKKEYLGWTFKNKVFMGYKINR